jgi:hypothetical protein
MSTERPTKRRKLEPDPGRKNRKKRKRVTSDNDEKWLDDGDLLTEALKDLNMDKNTYIGYIKHPKGYINYLLALTVREFDTYEDFLWVVDSLGKYNFYYVDYPGHLWFHTFELFLQTYDMAADAYQQELDDYEEAYENGERLAQEYD